MEPTQKYKVDFLLFLEAGFIAASQADEDAALKLLRAAELLDSKNALVKVGFGYLYFLKLELQKACGYFEEVLRENPNHEMASALLGLATSMTVKEVDKGEKILEEVLKKTGDKTVKSMVSTSLSFIDQFVKKQPTPVQGTLKRGSSKVKKGKK